jgi:hypothetical protein
MQRMTAKPGLKRSEFPTPKREKREGISADTCNDSIKFRSNGSVAESTYRHGRTWEQLFFPANVMVLKLSPDNELEGLQLNAHDQVDIIRCLIEASEMSNHLRVRGKVLKTFANLHMYRGCWSLLSIPFIILFNLKGRRLENLPDQTMPRK